MILSNSNIINQSWLWNKMGSKWQHKRSVPNCTIRSDACKGYESIYVIRKDKT